MREKLNWMQMYHLIDEIWDAHLVPPDPDDVARLRAILLSYATEQSKLNEIAHKRTKPEMTWSFYVDCLAVYRPESGIKEIDFCCTDDEAKKCVENFWEEIVGELRPGDLLVRFAPALAECLDARSASHDYLRYDSEARKFERALPRRPRGRASSQYGARRR